jgi:hypothetical protein
MILQLIYQVILLYIILLLGYDVFKEKAKMLQLTAALTIIPLLLRMLLIK